MTAQCLSSSGFITHFGFLFPSPPPGFAIYFFYGIKNSSEAANRSSPRKYEPALQNKSPSYKGAPGDSDMEAGSGP